MHRVATSQRVQAHRRVAAWLLLLALTPVWAGCGGGTGESGQGGVSVSSDLVSLSISPSFQTLPLNETVAFQVEGVLSDGSRVELTSEVDWSVRGNAIGDLSAAGELTALGSGSAVVTATHAPSGLEASALLTVSGANLVGIELSAESATVALGLPLQLTALGLLSDGSHVDLTGLVTWQAGDGGIVALGVDGLLMGIGLGSAVIVAVDPATGLRGQATVTVTPAVLQQIELLTQSLSLPLGLSEAVQAVGHFSDGSTLDVSGVVNWSAGGGALSVTDRGVVTALGLGSSVLTAVDPATGVKGTLPLQATPALLESLEVLPGTVSLLLGALQPFSAIGHYSDGSRIDLTHVVQWKSDNPLIASVNAQGQTLGLLLGLTKIRATDPSGERSAAADLSVLSALGGLLGN